MNRRSESGMTMVELLCAMGILGILLGIAVGGLKAIDRPLMDSTTSVDYFLRFVRTRAVASTKAMKVAPVSAKSLGVWSGDNCDSTTVSVPSMSLDLRPGCTMTDTSWSVCFDQRGFAKASAVFFIVDSQGSSKRVKIALGGGTSIDG